LTVPPRCFGEVSEGVTLTLTALTNIKGVIMKRSTITILSVGLLCSVATPVLSQSAQESCARLQQLTDQNRNRFNPAWVTEADKAAKRNNRDTCKLFVTQAEMRVKELNAQASGTSQQDQTQQVQQTGETDSSRIIVTQPQPEVTVQQNAPQIAVTQPQPEVTVNQQQPQIIVRQAQPTVRVQMPQPVITIEQPEPEIIVRMPQPQVAVNTPAPQVEVAQQQPQVQVEQAQPQVRVQMERPEVNVQPNQKAEVNVQQQQPVVKLKEQQQAQVNVQQAQPEVSFQAAEPKVEIEQTGQPKVQFNQTGKAQIRVEQLGQNEQQAASEPNAQQQAANQSQNAEVTGSTDIAGISAMDRERIGSFREDQRQVEATSIPVSELLNKQVVNLRGEKLGKVELVLRRGNRDVVAVAHGGFLGFGKPRAVLPVERMSIDNKGNVVLLGLTEEEFENLPQLQTADGQPLMGNQTIKMSRLQQ
jgi:ribosomal 30S subunit maturation factor RimM